MNIMELIIAVAKALIGFGIIAAILWAVFSPIYDDWKKKKKENEQKN